jgi:hypothetical protein
MELNELTRWMTDTVRTAHREWDTPIPTPAELLGVPKPSGADGAENGARASVGGARRELAAEGEADLP